MMVLHCLAFGAVMVLFFRQAREGELSQRLIEAGVDPDSVGRHRAGTAAALARATASHCAPGRESTLTCAALRRRGSPRSGPRGRRRARRPPARRAGGPLQRLLEGAVLEGAHVAAVDADDVVMVLAARHGGLVPRRRRSRRWSRPRLTSRSSTR